MTPQQQERCGCYCYRCLYGIHCYSDVCRPSTVRVFVGATSGSRVVEQRFSGARKGRLAAKMGGDKDGPGGAGNTVILGLTTREGSG